MSHLGQEVLRRILRGEGGPQETESVAEHLLACDPCRALAATLLGPLRAASPRLRGEGSLQRVFDRIDQEHRCGVEALAAIAEWAELRRLPSRQSQRDRVRMGKACHTLAFFRLLLDELKEAPAWEEAEFLARLALLSVEAMSQRRQITPPAGHDLQAEVWTAVANARRRAAEWSRAHQALANAERHRKEGTGARRLEAGLLSIAASTLADEGHVAQALETLERCRAIYEDLSEWALVARTLVQLANILEPIEPAKGLVALDRAAPLIPEGDSYLLLLAELLRVECLIGVDNPTEALRVFQRSSRLLAGSPQIRLRIRGRVTCARLLDGLGYRQQAERLFHEVIDRDIEHEHYKDAFLDLLALYGHHVKSGDFEKAGRVCQRALTDPTLSTLAHEQLRTVWEQLLQATQRQAIGQDLLRELRQYFTAHWKNPASHPPVVTFR
jgi:tetratricopeptide (TPR) repeat protein